MKRFSFLTFFAAAVIASCEVGEPMRPYDETSGLPKYNGDNNDTPWSTFVFSSEDADSKTAHSGQTILWSAGDQIRMGYTINNKWQGRNGNATTSSPAKMYQSDGLEQGGESASFSISGQFPDSGSGSYHFYTVYPASAAEDGDDLADAPLILLNIPTEQTPPVTSFDTAADLMIGQSTGAYQSKPSGAIPIMWDRKVAHGEITLKRLNEISGFSAQETIESVTLTAGDGEYLTGLFLYDFTDEDSGLVEEEAVNSVTVNGDNLSWNNGTLTFWISILPVEMTSITVKIVTNAATYTKTYSSISRTFDANTRNTLNIGMAYATRTENKQYYEKVTTAPSDWSGDYLIVYESGNLAFDGSRNTLDAANNTISVTIDNGRIEKNSETEAAQFAIATVSEGYSIKSASGYFIGRTTTGNGLSSSKTEVYVNTISVSSGSASIRSSGGSYLKYNNTDTGKRFRYYGSGQEAIQLYKLGGASGGTTPDPDPEATATVTTSDATGVTTSAATLNGSYDGETGNISEVGFYWGTTQTPGAKVTGALSGKSFSKTLNSGLQAGTTYYFKAYVKEYNASAGAYEERFGALKSFTTEEEHQSGTGDYVLVTANQSDWSGDYVLGHLDSKRILNGITTSGTIYGTYKEVPINNNTISNSDGSSCEITIAASNGHYTMYLKNVGYLGWTSGNTLTSSTSVSSNNYRWDFSYSSGTLTISNAQSTSRKLQYNSGSPRFACYDGSDQQAPSLFIRSGTSTPQITVTTGNASNVLQTSATLNGSFSGVTTGLSVTEIGFYFGTSNNPTEKFTVTGTSTPFTYNKTGLNESTTYYYKAYAIESDGSTTRYRYGEVKQFTTSSSGGGSSTGSQQGWYELPKMNIQESGNYYINSTNSSEYYAWHMCTGGEKGPGNKTARNYTVCYSSTHHCPVWVAAPRHSMYVGGSGRNDSYRKDSLIPSTIQYSSTSTGGGCNKGHMLGSAERTSSVSTNKDVFYYPNIAPQLSSGFNTGGGGWNLLEEFVDGQVCSDTLYVVIGCYFDAFSHTYKKNNSTVTISQSPSTISFGGRSDVHMPTMFYYVLLRTKKGNSGKALKDCNASEMKCAAFVRTHSNELKGVEITSYDMMTVSDLEALTGVEYFTNVSNAPKGTATASDWFPEQ